MHKEHAGYIWVEYNRFTGTGEYILPYRPDPPDKSDPDKRPDWDDYYRIEIILKAKEMYNCALCIHEVGYKHPSLKKLDCKLNILGAMEWQTDNELCNQDFKSIPKRIIYLKKGQIKPDKCPKFKARERLSKIISKAISYWEERRKWVKKQPSDDYADTFNLEEATSKEEWDKNLCILWQLYSLSNCEDCPFGIKKEWCEDIILFRERANHADTWKDYLEASDGVIKGMKRKVDIKGGKVKNGK